MAHPSAFRLYRPSRSPGSPSEGPGLSNVAGEGRLDGPRRAAAEQIDVHQKRVKLVKGRAVRVAGREGEGLLIGVENAPAEAAEQAHHSEVHFPVPAVRCRVDQAWRAVLVGVEV